MTKDEKLIESAKEAFKQAQDAESDNRIAFADDLRFARLGEQWPAQVKRQRELEGRPCLTVNRMPSFIRQVVNDSRMNKPSIKTHPVDDGADRETADIINGLIRNIEVTSNADVAYDTAVDNAVSGGFGYWRVNIDYACEDAFDLDIRIERITNPLTVYGDPKSTAADSSDWNECFVTESLTYDEFEKRWPKAEKTDWNALKQEDKGALWFMDDSLQVVEYWKREEVEKEIFLLSDGQVMGEQDYLAVKEILDLQGITIAEQRTTRSHKVTQYIMTGAEVLESNPWPGKYIPIVPVYGEEVIVEGKRYFLSLIRHAKDSQQMYNFWRTASTELVALAPKAPFIGPKGAFKTDSGKWATANAKSHPYIEYDGNVPPQRQPFAGPPAGAIQEALNASDDMKSVMGIYDASLGARSNETSGKAILARQREGDIGTFHFIDNLARAIRHTGRIIVDLIPKIYTKARIIRTLAEDGTPGMVPVNQETIINGIPKLFNLTVGKYDVTVESGPGFTTRREEAANQMMQLVQSFPQAAPLIGDLIAKNLDWPGADEIQKRLKAMLPPQIQGQNPQLKQAQDQMKQMGNDLQALMQKFNELRQDKALESRKLDIDAYNAETNRLKAVPPITTEDVQMIVMQTIRQALSSPDVLPGPPVQMMPTQPPEGGFFTS
jgi:hypothetical protein